MISNKLAEIINNKREEIKRIEPHAEELRKIALKRDDFRGFRRHLNQPGMMTLIAEVKKASPSAGVIAADFDPIRQAQAYEAAGADALSVLTDEKYFQGSLSYLMEIRRKVKIPLLRKDFIVEPVQVYESIIAGADAILLIVAALEQEKLQELYDLAHGLQLDVLVEVHNLEEMDRALDIGADIIGINNRNLKTFEVTLKTTEELVQEIPGDCLAVSESGIKTREDVRFCAEQGINTLLIGETLMRSADVAKTIQELFDRP